MSAARLARLVRLRAIEHRVAAAAAARAHAELANVETIGTRIDGLRATLVVPSTLPLSRDLHAFAEMSARLDCAQQSLTRSRAEAVRVREARDGARLMAQRAEERAGRLHAKLIARDDADAERRADARTIARRRRSFVPC